MSLHPQTPKLIPSWHVVHARPRCARHALHRRLRRPLSSGWTAGRTSLAARAGDSPAIRRDLTDRQAAEAVRARIDWKYALSLELTDPDFDFTVLSQFRTRLLAGEGEQGLLDQLDHLKYLGQYTGVVHVLLGTYELRAFRTVNAQLGRRSLDVHFPRYDATQADDRVAFRSTLWSFQRNLPLIAEPELKDTEWEYLYTRTIGCVGTLKQWLARALDRAIHEGAPTLTHAHLQATAPASARVEAAFQEAIEGEAEMRERADADSYLFDLVGLTQRRGTSAPLKSITAGPGAGGLGRTDTAAGSDARQGHPARPTRRPFVRKPQRDPIGPPNASSATGEAS